MAAKPNPLDTYNQKRDFAKTAEPAGAVADPRSEFPLLFLVQKHDATRLHYDLRLELDGVLKSWAVPNGPSCDPNERRAAGPPGAAPAGAAPCGARRELDGVRKSWAVPSGPSCDPSERRLAVQTEDHPMEYATWEGVIPKG